MWAAKHCSILFSPTMNRLFIFCCAYGFQDWARDYMKNIYCDWKLTHITQFSKYNFYSKAKNATDLLQVVNSTGLLPDASGQQVATNLSISNKYVKNFSFVAACRLQTCENLLKQLAASLWITVLQQTC